MNNHHYHLLGQHLYHLVTPTLAISTSSGSSFSYYFRPEILYASLLILICKSPRDKKHKNENLKTKKLRSTEIYLSRIIEFNQRKIFTPQENRILIDFGVFFFLV